MWCNPCANQHEWHDHEVVSIKIESVKRQEQRIFPYPTSIDNELEVLVELSEWRSSNTWNEIIRKRDVWLSDSVSLWPYNFTLFPDFLNHAKIHCRFNPQQSFFILRLRMVQPLAPWMPWLFPPYRPWTLQRSGDAWPTAVASLKVASVVSKPTFSGPSSKGMPKKCSKKQRRSVGRGGFGLMAS